MGLFEFCRIGPKDQHFQDIFKLRFQVYCYEWGFEKEEDHPDGVEVDDFDRREQCVYVGAVHKESRELIGTARIIMLSHPPEAFPTEEHYLRRDLFGEISRLAVTKNFSRRADDLHNIVQRDDLPEVSQSLIERRTIENDIVFGLYRAICAESKVEGLEYWYASMARGLFLLLKRRGVNFTPIGPEKDYHGLRRAYIGYIPDVLRENNVLLDAYTGGAF